MERCLDEASFQGWAHKVEFPRCHCEICEYTVFSKIPPGIVINVITCGLGFKCSQCSQRLCFEASGNSSLKVQSRYRTSQWCLGGVIFWRLHVDVKVFWCWGSLTGAFDVEAVGHGGSASLTGGAIEDVSHIVWWYCLITLDNQICRRNLSLYVDLYF